MMSEADLLYDMWLNDVYNSIEENKEMFEKSVCSFKKPIILFKNGKTVWTNFENNCNEIDRTIEEVQTYINNECKTTTSINENKQLIFRGKYKYEVLSEIFKKYIDHCVFCTTCKSLKTQIIKNTTTRLYGVHCLNDKCNTVRVIKI